MSDIQKVDLFVIGGSINGAGIARDAAGRGLSVVLCEKDDLAEGTSSRSGKLVHGGLRYLEYYEFRLVRESADRARSAAAELPRISSGRCALSCRIRRRTASGAGCCGWGCSCTTISAGANRCRRRARMDLHRDRRRAPLSRTADARVRIFRLAGSTMPASVVLNAVDAAERGATMPHPVTDCTSARRDGNAWRVTTQNSVTGETREFEPPSWWSMPPVPWVDQVLVTARGRAATRRAMCGWSRAATSSCREFCERRACLPLPEPRQAT